MNYWLFNAEQVASLDCDSADLWFKHKMGFSGSDRKQYGEPLRKLDVSDIVLMYQNGKGYVGIGKVRNKWDGKAYNRPLVYKGCGFPEYRIEIVWYYDARSNPFSIGFVSPAFLQRVSQPELLARVKGTVAKLTNSETGPLLDTQAATDYKPDNKDHRDRVSRQICTRRGQQRFRNDLIERYGPTCQITGCKLLDIIEAAHICPYRGEKDNVPGNGLLLRSDMHTLFDLDLIGIDPDSLKIHCTQAAAEAYGEQLVGRRLSCPQDRTPSRTALKKRFKIFIGNGSTG